MVTRQKLDPNERISPEADFISNEVDYMKFVDRLYGEEGIDLAQYKQNQMRRRLNMLVRQAGYETYCTFLDHAKQNDDVYRRFIDRITINVSEFIRNPDKFKILEEKYIPQILERNPNPLIFSAGCSTGEEPYSLALLLKKQNAGPATRIVGWDFDQNALNHARAGIYEDSALKNVPPDLLKKYFKQLPNDRSQVTDELKSMLRLDKHNLLEDRFPVRVDMILCRNVVIYFNEAAKNELFTRFGAVLELDGILMIGASERIPNPDDANLRALEPFFYARKDSNFTSSMGRKQT